MRHRRLLLALLLAPSLLVACGAPSEDHVATTLPTAVIAPQLVATSNALVDTPILDYTPIPDYTPVPPLATSTAVPTLAAESPIVTAQATALSFEPLVPLRVLIEAIGLDQPLVPVGLDDAALPIVPRHDVGWYAGSAAPGEGENIVLWAHALRFLDAPHVPAPFGSLNNLPVGAHVLIYDQHGTSHTYVVAQQVWATPDQVEYILPQGHERLTMISCIGVKVETPAGLTMSHRLITIAEPEG